MVGLGIIILIVLSLFGILEFEPKLDTPIGEFNIKSSQVKVYPDKIKFLSFGGYLENIKIVNYSEKPVYNLTLVIRTDSDIKILEGIKLESLDPPLLKEDVGGITIDMNNIIFEGTDPVTGGYILQMSIKSIDPKATLNYKISVPKIVEFQEIKYLYLEVKYKVGE